MEKEMITITLEEYKELLIIKGRYLEKQPTINVPSAWQPQITYPWYLTTTASTIDLNNK